jgi:hypothetical protein
MFKNAEIKDYCLLGDVTPCCLLQMFRENAYRHLKKCVTTFREKMRAEVWGKMRGDVKGERRDEVSENLVKKKKKKIACRRFGNKSFLRRHSK